MKISRTIATLLLASVGALAATPPDQTIREATEKLQTQIKQHRAEYQGNSGKFYAMVDEVVVPHFDQKYIGQLVLGRNWRGASEEQRTRFISAFKNSLVHSYADALLEYADTVKAEWKPVRAADNANEASVNATLVRKDGPPIPIGFSVRLVDNDWKVYDVVVDGISLAVNFRSQFGGEIKKNGLDALIKRLEGGGEPLQKKALQGQRSS
jgi:phospholipid transport system substrate-binding protein